MTRLWIVVMLAAVSAPAATTIINPGVTLYMDMTQAAGAMYRIFSDYYVRGISADCSGGAQCSIQGYGGVTSIDYGTGYKEYGVFKNVLFKNVGDASTLAMRAGAQTGVGSNTVDVEGSVFDTCGSTFIANIDPASVFKWANNIHRSSPKWYLGNTITPNLYWQTNGAISGGTRLVSGNAFDGSISTGLTANGSIIGVDGFTFTNNVLTGGIYGWNTSPWTLFQNNVWRWAPQTVGDGDNMGDAGSIDNSYLLADAPLLINSHYLLGMPSNSTVSR